MPSSSFDEGFEPCLDILKLRNLVACLRAEPAECAKHSNSLATEFVRQQTRPSSLPPPRVNDTCGGAVCPASRRAISCDSRGRFAMPHTCNINGAPSIDALQERMAAASGSCLGVDFGGSSALRTVAEAALQLGRMFLNVGELVDAISAIGRISPPAAVAMVRMAWEAGDLQSYSDVTKVLQPQLLSQSQGPEELRAVVEALREVHVSPVCTCLTWPLLSAVLSCLRREQIRSSLDIVLEVCHGVFCLECDMWDVIVAVALAPKGACTIDATPWPLMHLEAMDKDPRVLTTTTLALSDSSDLSAESKVFPPYAASLAAAVEEDFRNYKNDASNMELWLRGAHEAATADGLVLTVPIILALLASEQLASSFSGGALLWYWEKICVNAKSPADCGGRTSEGVGGGAPDVSSDAASEFSEDGSAASRELHDGAEDTKDGLTPLEAFISCFYDDLKSNQPLFLSQLNNLYRMRSGGHDIKYRSYGYSRMGEFLAEVPGVEIVGTGNQMAVQVSDQKKLADLEKQVIHGLQQRIEEKRMSGADTTSLTITYQRPQPVPKKILARVWDIFQNAEHNEIPVNLFVTFYKDRFPYDKLRFKSLGHQDVRSLMAHVPFIEKVGGRRHAKYVLKADAVPPEGYSRHRTGHRTSAPGGSHLGGGARDGKYAQRHFPTGVRRTARPPHELASSSMAWQRPAPVVTQAVPQHRPVHSLGSLEQYLAGRPAMSVGVEQPRQCVSALPPYACH